MGRTVIDSGEYGPSSTPSPDNQAPKRSGGTIAGIRLWPRHHRTRFRGQDGEGLECVTCRDLCERALRWFGFTPPFSLGRMWRSRPRSDARSVPEDVPMCTFGPLGPNGELTPHNGRRCSTVTQCCLASRWAINQRWQAFRSPSIQNSAAVPLVDSADRVGARWPSMTPSASRRRTRRQHDGSLSGSAWASLAFAHPAGGGPG